MKNNFPGLKITLVLDGLYPNGPVFTLCRKNKWDFMITLKDGSLKELWEDAKGIMKLEPGNELIQDYGDRRQEFQWANLLEYTYSYTSEQGTQVTKTEKVNIVLYIRYRSDEIHEKIRVIFPRFCSMCHSKTRDGA